MIQLIKNISLVIMSIVVIYATGGINVYKHYCFCTGETVQSLFDPGIECEHEGDKLICDSEITGTSQLHACCATSTEKQDNANSCHDDHNCCNNDYTFFKTDQFDYAKSVKKSFQFMIAYQSVLNFGYVENESEKSGLQFIPQNNPPPLYGADLLKALHQLKISIPVIA